jgi:hypothetical protein
VLGDVVPQQRHVPAIAVMTHVDLRDVDALAATPRGRIWLLSAARTVIEGLERMSSRRHDQQVTRRAWPSVTFAVEADAPPKNVHGGLTPNPRGGRGLSAGRPWALGSSDMAVGALWEGIRPP